MQRKVVIRREVYHETWPEIAKQVRDLRGKVPTPRLVADYYRRFSTRHGRVLSKYKNCGRKPYKVTKEVEKHLLQTLKKLRCKMVCTSTTLQLDLAQKKGVRLSVSWIRKVLVRNGYKWLPKCQKRKYDQKARAARVAFARHVLSLSKAQLREKLSMAMDGVVLAMPPRDPTERFNFCKYGEDHIWRKGNEALSPLLAGADEYGKQ
eukprot:12367277-Karenia_brevis.AAC.1